MTDISDFTLKKHEYFLILFDRRHAIHTNLMNGKINIDNLFKAAFEDFEAQPSSEMLDNILGDAFDISVQSSFEDFSLPPSAYIWENINDAIPTAADKVLSTSFDEFTAVPPIHLWENISESIHSEADKLLNNSFDEFAVTPPAHLWENISDSIPSEVDHLAVSSFDEFAVTPPVGMWASIQEELNVEENFDSKFQEAFLAFEAQPSEHILDNLLNTKFDTGVRRAFMRHEVSPQEAVWDRIKPYVRFGPSIQRHLPTLRRVAAVVLCLLMFTFLYNKLDRGGIIDIVGTNPDKTKTTTKKDIEPTIPIQNEEEQPLKSIFEDNDTEGIVSVEKQPVNNETPEKNTNIDQRFTSKSPLLSVKENNRFDLSATSSVPPVSTVNDKAVLLSSTFSTTVTPTENERTEELISSVSNIEISELETYIPGTIISQTDWNNLELPETPALQGFREDYLVESNLMDMGEDSDLAKMMLSYKGFYLSSSFSSFYSRIYNDAVRESLSEDPLDYLVDGGVSFGIGAGYQLTPNFGIEAEVTRTNLSQSYRELTEQTVFNSASSLKTTYLYIPLSFKYQLSRSNSMNRRIPRTFSTVLGMHYGKLQSTQTIEERPIPEDAFIQQELGVFTGLDYHFYFSPNIHVTLGGRLAAGTDFEYLSAPFEAGTPYNVQAGVRIGLNYRFATRKYKWDRGIY